MGLDAGPDAGGFEPIPAKFYQVKYPTTSFGEALATPEETIYCTRYYRWQKTYGRELVDLGNTKAPQTSIIEIRRDSMTSLITTNMTVFLNGRNWGIDDIQPKANNAAFLVVSIKSLQPASVAP